MNNRQNNKNTFKDIIRPTKKLGNFWEQEEEEFLE